MTTMESSILPFENSTNKPASPIPPSENSTNKPASPIPPSENSTIKPASPTPPPQNSTSKPESAIPPSENPTNKPERLPITVTKPIPYTFDLGNLLIHDNNPLPHSPSEPELQACARDCAQALLNQLLTTCPLKSHPDTGVMMTLPPPTFPLPREKPLPQKKAATKWELFAAKKGIRPKREDTGKKVYDEATGEWVPKWGYKGKNKEGEGDWIVEVDEKQDREREREKEKVRRKEKRRERERIGEGRKLGGV